MVKNCPAWNIYHIFSSHRSSQFDPEYHPDNSFSFELHTRGEIIHFTEHNPKQDINLEKGENCLLLWRVIPQNIEVGSKIYVYYNI